MCSFVPLHVESCECINYLINKHNYICLKDFQILLEKKVMLGQIVEVTVSFSD